MNNAMNTRFIFVIIIVLFVLFVFAGTYPSKIYKDQSYLCMRTALGFKTRIPISEIVYKPVPHNILSGLVRTFGSHIGNRFYGTFYSRTLEQNIFLFIVDDKNLVCFEYKGKVYVVNECND